MDKRKRSSNFSKEEELLFMDQIEKYKNILECKATDKVTNFKKNEAWSALTSSFNAINQVVRTTNQLKSKYDNLKSRARKIESQEKYYMKATGGEHIYKSDENVDKLVAKDDIKEEENSITSDNLNLIVVECDVKEDETSISPDYISETDNEYNTPEMVSKEKYYTIKTAVLDEELKLKKMEVEDRVTKRAREEVEHQMKIKEHNMQLEEHNIRLQILKCDLILKKREIGVKYNK